MGSKERPCEHLDALWEKWEKAVEAYGFDANESQEICLKIEEIEQSDIEETVKVHANAPDSGLAKAHRAFDVLMSRRQGRQRVNHLMPGQRIVYTAYGAIYENCVSVRGIERLMSKQTQSLPAIRLKDGFYHVNNLPGVQPSASAAANVRNKNVERVNVEVVERFIRACQASGMSKRGWKKAVNEEFDINRQEFTKWLERYFPCFGLPVPIERKQ